MSKKHQILCLFLVGYLFSITACIDYKLKNEQLIEKLNSQMKDGEYEQIYNESSSSAKNYKYSKEEFIERLKTIVDKIKETDESLTFIKPKGIYGDEAVYRDDNFANRYVENKGKKFGIIFWLDSDSGRLSLLDICIYPEDKFDMCASDASKS